MGFFGNNVKRVTSIEMRDILQNLYGKLDDDERIEVEKLFRADLYEPGLEEGVTKIEFDAAIAWLKANPRKHVLEQNDIALIEKYFGKHLND